MSSDSSEAVTPSVVYRSARRTVVTDGSRVVEIGGGDGWMRSVGSGGPMSGEVLATLSGGEWSRELVGAEAVLAAYADAQ